MIDQWPTDSYKLKFLSLMVSDLPKGKNVVRNAQGALLNPIPLDRKSWCNGRTIVPASLLVRADGQPTPL
jgi:hypothetical protein